MQTTSVSELKNTLSAKLKRVKAGESLLVTDRRKPIAILQPVDHAAMSQQLAGLVADGIARPPRKKLDMKALDRLPLARCSESLTAAVLEEREEGR